MREYSAKEQETDLSTLICFINDEIRELDAGNIAGPTDDLNMRRAKLIAIRDQLFLPEGKKNGN